MTYPNSAQRDLFLSGEGDAWFQRNRRTGPLQSEADDLLLPALINLPLKKGSETIAAEVGCGQGLRLHKLASQKGWFVCGVDPSSEAVSAASELGVEAKVGTADLLPFGNQSIDLLIFGFCLYLCDPNLLFKISAEAHRVLKPSSWLAILDFWSPYQRNNIYKHNTAIRSFKDNFPAMFSWHPSYVITDHQIRHHGKHSYTDKSDEWVSATVIRRFDPPQI